MECGGVGERERRGDEEVAEGEDEGGGEKEC